MCSKIIVVLSFVLNVWVSSSQESTYAKPEWGTYSTEGGFLLAHISNWPVDGKLVLDRSIKPREARLISKPSKNLKIRLIDKKLTVLLPQKGEHSGDEILKIQLIPNEDWANLNKYKKANKELKELTKKENRVVFMGNSITEKWDRDGGTFFELNPSYINRGISGQTSSQMLVRFRPDVLELKPKVVIISAGTNDIAGNRGPITIERIAGNIFSMAELANANEIQVILASVLPASSYSWSPSIEPIDKIKALNKYIKEYAKTNNIVYLDYYTPMVNKNEGLKKEFGNDTVHPNAKGYKEIMIPLVEKAIKKALKK